ncbi:MAG TPA: FHA domain-containing protein [Candidatus Marinimicrobia bacterium]|nr:FHA domain-containing protein [Candidatus Neomarinimicrobiota bacterium]
MNEHYLFINDKYEIKKPTHFSKDITWGMQNNEDLMTEKKENSIIIEAKAGAKSLPRREIWCTDRQTGEDAPFVIHILELPATKVLTGKAAWLIEGSQNFPPDTIWRFSDERLNQHIEKRADGIVIKNLNNAFSKLRCTLPDGREKSIEIQVRISIDESGFDSGASSSFNQSSEQVPTSSTPSTPALPPQPSNPAKNYPTLTDNFRISVYNAQKNKVTEFIPDLENASALIGKKSSSQKVVDLDLKPYTQQSDKISRNHLKIWRKANYVIMKNIGSHRVSFKGQEMKPEKEAYLSIGAEICIGDLTLIVEKI